MVAGISQVLKSVSPLQLGLIIAGVVLVVGVLIYNWWLERRVQRRITATFRKPDGVAVQPGGGAPLQRVEPTLRNDASGATMPANAVPAFRPDADEEAAADWEPPIDVVAQGPVSVAPADEYAATIPMARSVDGDAGGHRRPDPEIECIVTLQPAKPVGVGRAGCRAACAARQAIAMVRPGGAGGPVAAPRIGYARRFRRHRRLPVARGPQWRGQPRAARYVRARRGRARTAAARGDLGPRCRGRDRSRRNA
jgi:hypothetical protein